MKCTSIDIPGIFTNIKTRLVTPRSEENNQTLKTFKNETVPELKNLCGSVGKIFEKVLTITIVTGGLTGIAIILYQFVLLIQFAINKNF